MLLTGSAMVLLGVGTQLLDRIFDWGAAAGTSQHLAVTLVICRTVIIVSGLLVVAFVRLKALSHAANETWETTRQLPILVRTSRKSSKRCRM
jgi:hypothetical protein